MEQLPKDINVYIVLMLDLPEVLSLCKSSKNFNRTVCNNNDFWIKRLQQDFGINYLNIGKGDPKLYYMLLKSGVRRNELRQRELAWPIFADIDEKYKDLIGTGEYEDQLKSQIEAIKEKTERLLRLTILFRGKKQIEFNDTIIKTKNLIAATSVYLMEMKNLKRRLFVSSKVRNLIDYVVRIFLDILSKVEEIGVLNKSELESYYTLLDELYEHLKTTTKISLEEFLKQVENQNNE